jgi:hypothetical protein
MSAARPTLEQMVDLVESLGMTMTREPSKRPAQSRAETSPLANKNSSGHRTTKANVRSYPYLQISSNWDGELLMPTSASAGRRHYDYREQSSAAVFPAKRSLAQSSRAWVLA